MSKLTETQFDSSEDELPEEIAFDQSKSVALKSVKDALESAKREKTLLKEKRKKRQQLFQEQKKKKCLPADVLQEFDEMPQRQTKASDNNSDDEETLNEEETISKTLQDSYSVMRLKDNSSAISLQQRATDFIQSRLYGPGTRRTTSAELLSLSRKKGTNQGAAVEFINKKISADCKAKAEKSNKRFRHKQKLVPS
ncbi:U3 small nucleolar RNA-associated protein NOL7 [Paramisgurnus dabryanus]|uniref:U3 small nucleolar RNA-associated protein NOL7 n=1 Tax=Paramisgurnus dabryanus TaxID=90735 RepID=UPI0031F3FC9A